MISSHSQKRVRAVSLRKKGWSLKRIHARLGIPLSTLSGWLQTVELTEKQKEQLRKNWEQALVHARTKASVWHRKQKAKRLLYAKKEAQGVLAKIEKDDNASLELALAFLYLGEGAKRSDATALGNSDPLILRFFLSSVKKLYGVENDHIRCYLHLRADQDADVLKRYWSRTLQVPIGRFGKSSHDMRTQGRPTYSMYKGVCIINCSRVAIQRRLMYIADSFCRQNYIRSNKGAVSSVGRASA